MLEEEKQLLLQDLCARLSYGVICNDNRHGSGRVTYIDITPDDIEQKNGKVVVYYFDFDECGELKNCKPYLRPMSSMTEEEKEEISQKLNYEFYVDEDAALCVEDERHRIRLDLIEVYIDWLNKNHFDYRGLIEKGLALEASEGMYNITK